MFKGPVPPPYVELSKIEQDYLQEQLNKNKNFVKLQRKENDPRSRLENSILQLISTDGAKLLVVMLKKSKLGEGDNARVTIGWDLHYKKTVAIKHGELGKHELEALSILGYLYGSCTRFSSITRRPKLWQMYTYAAIKYFPGISLEKCSAKGKGPFARLDLISRLKLAKKLTQDLEKLHKHGLYHNDMASRNIMVDFDYSDMHLVDFGNAHPIEVQTVEDIQDQEALNPHLDAAGIQRLAKLSKSTCVDFKDLAMVFQLHFFNNDKLPELAELFVMLDSETITCSEIIYKLDQLIAKLAIQSGPYALEPCQQLHFASAAKKQRLESGIELALRLPASQAVEPCSPKYGKRKITG
jgi:serine/threonine protein kinase